MVLDVIPQCMKTLTLLLATKSDGVCDSIADTYVQLHRLFVALIQEHPTLRFEIRARLKCFIRGDKHERSKDTVPSLGDLFPLLSVCPEYTYADLVRPYFLEQLDRGVIWTFREFPQLAKRSRKLRQGVDQELLEKSFEARKVSLRLVIINRAVLDILLRPAASASIADSCQKHDYLFGHASPSSKTLFVQSITKALCIKNWGGFLVQAGIHMNDGNIPSPLMLTDWLKKSADNSEHRGYHKRGMNFTRVHKSGGSRILRKGEGQGLGAVSKIRLSDSWRWDNEQMFLDASILTFDFRGKHLSTLDYANQQQRGMTHSGDVMDYANQKGKHTLEVCLHRLDRKVQSVVVVLSAFNDATMEQALLPNVAVTDTDSGQELCRYELEARATALQGMKNVVMCRIWRQEPGAAWRVDAVGAISAFGDATCYQPIITDLEATYKSKQSKKEVKWERGIKPTCESKN